MRTALAVVAAFATLAHGEWVTLTEQDFAATWKPVSGNWTIADGVITGVAEAGESAVLLTAGTYHNLSLELEFKTESPAVGAVAVQAHWLADAPHPGEQFPLFGNVWPIDTVDTRRMGMPYRDELLVNAAPVKKDDWNSLVFTTGDEPGALLNGESPLGDVELYHSWLGWERPFISGCIALVVTPGHKIQFRNIRINDLGRKGTWRALFNGTDFTGWKIWGTEEWKVEDGIITGSSGPKKSEGYLATEETWKDFRVRGSFRMLGEGNFGLFYHSTIAYNDEQYPVISGLQGEVAPGYPSPTGWVYESYKRGWLVEPDMNTYRAYALRPGDWNEIEIKSEGNHITTWVNGIQVLNLVDKQQQLTVGSFALQLHTGGTDGIQWKDLYVLDRR